MSAHAPSEGEFKSALREGRPPRREDARGESKEATRSVAKKTTKRTKKKKKKKAKTTSAASTPLVRAGGGFKLPAEPSTRITHPDVLNVLSADRDEGEVPYAQQGDPSMYTEEALAKRKELSRNQAVVNTIGKLLKLFSWTEHGTVTRGAYYDMHKRMVQVLLPKTTTVEALSLAKADWERDSGGASELTREQAYDAVFQLIDIWTASLDIAEYLALTNALYFRLSLGATAKDLINKSAVIGGAGSTAVRAQSRPGSSATASGVDDAGVGAGAGAGAGAGST